MVLGKEREGLGKEGDAGRGDGHVEVALGRHINRHDAGLLISGNPKANLPRFEQRLPGGFGKVVDVCVHLEGGFSLQVRRPIHCASREVLDAHIEDGKFVDVAEKHNS